MRIGIDYLPAVSHWPGVGRYARELVRALVRLPRGGPELYLFEVGRTPRIVDEAALGLAPPEARSVRRLSARAPRKLLDAAAAFGFAADRWLGGVDLFHQTAPEPVPVRRARETFAVAELPDPGTPAEERFRARCLRAAGVLAFSSCAALELTERFGVDEGRVHRVPVGCDHWLRDLGAAPPRDDPPSIVVLGALRAPSRHAKVLQATSLLAAAGTRASVVAVGRLAHVLAGGVGEALSGRLDVPLTVFDELPERELARTVARASALVHLNDDEATAVTPLEAFALGTPVVASRIPCFEEALGDDAVLVDNAALDADPGVLARALAEALDSARDPAAEGRRRARAARFTWEANALATVEAWHAVHRA